MEVVLTDPTIRVSSIANWTTCEAMALESPPRQFTETCAQFVGTLAHSKLAGDINEIEPDTYMRGRRIMWDTVTPAPFHAVSQAGAIARVASATLESDSWDIVEQEGEIERGRFTGHYDLVVRNRLTREFGVFDLKTGQVGAGWLQVGGYLTLMDKRELTWGGILHVPRVRIGQEPKANLTVRPADQLKAAWEVASRRIEDISQGAIPTRSPGIHCGQCNAVCVVRANKEGR